MPDYVRLVTLAVVAAALFWFYVWLPLSERPPSLPFVWKWRGVVLVKVELAFSSSFWGWPPPGRDRPEPVPMTIHVQTWSSFVRRGQLVPAALSAVLRVVLEPGLQDDGTLVRLEGDPVSTVLERARTFTELSAPPGAFRFDGHTVTRC
jgi:hypothetical protein